MTTKTVVPLGLTRDQWHRYFWNGKGPMPGVTSILRIQDAVGGDGLVKWGAGIAADYVMAHVDDGMTPEVLRNTAVAQTDELARIGTAVHEQVRRVLHGEAIVPDPETVYHMAHFGVFLYAERPEVFFAEELIANLAFGYGGAFDFLARIRDKYALVDVKTGKLKASHRLQIAGYMDAEFMGRPGSAETVPMPEIEAGYVLLLRVDGYELVDVTPTTADREHWRFLAEVFPRLKKWSKEEAS